MARSQTRSTPRGPARGTLARPLDALVFLLPLILFCEAAALWRNDRVIAFDFFRQFLELFGQVGVWAPGLAVVVILLATHVVSREAWRVHWRQIGWMYAESVLLALPLLMLSWAVRLAGGLTAGGLLHRLAVGVGAGIYEELVFRLILISLIVLLAADLLRMNRRAVAVAAIVLSSLAFAAHHHPPIGSEPFDPVRFTFRGAAGAYLAVIFWFRGYGPAAGCHAAYNVLLIVNASFRVW